MSELPPPYPTDEKKGPDAPMYGPPQPQGGYPQPQQTAGYPPQQPPPGYPQPGYPSGPPPPGGGYPPSGYPAGQPPMAGQQTTVIVSQPTTVFMGFKNYPTSVTCPSCHQNVTTLVHYDTGTVTWLACLGLCIIGCDLGCCLIPFCIDDLQDAVHTCPNCRTVVGRYNRL